MIHLRVAKGCQPTADILSQLLAKEGVQLAYNGDATVCWGAGSAQSSKILNSKCSAFNKLIQLQKLSASGIPIVPIVGQDVHQKWMHGNNPVFPVLARKLQHVGGRDIILCRSPKGCRKALARGRAYFTRFVSSTTEFRVWIYRKRHLGTYEKFLKYPWKKRGCNRNYKNGYAFQLVTQANLPQAAIELARKCIATLDLDFGAVDILRANNGQFVVLEVNTAPGVEGEGRMVIQKLAHRIAKWEAAGYPNRTQEQGSA